MNRQPQTYLDDATQATYALEAATRWGEACVRASNERWAAHSPAQRDAIMAEANAIYTALAAYIGHDPAQPAVQALVGRWHDHLRNSYEPTSDVLRGLGQLYVEDERFVSFYERIASGLAPFLSQAITIYCDRL